MNQNERIHHNSLLDVMRDGKDNNSFAYRISKDVKFQDDIIIAPTKKVTPQQHVRDIKNGKTILYGNWKVIKNGKVIKSYDWNWTPKEKTDFRDELFYYIF